MESKTSKYFKYAIGEIVLVVIGILIALQINNWNEDRKAKNNELVLLTKLKEENLLNLKSLEDHIDFRKGISKEFYDFIDLLESKNLKEKTQTAKTQLSNILTSAAYTFIQSNLTNYINTHNSKKSTLSKELATLEFYQNDLQLSSTKGLDLKIKYVYESLSDDFDFNNLKIVSYNTLESLRFKNNMVLMASVESEVSQLFTKTLKQMQKVDSLITKKLK